jgi:hypothetical protein
MKNNQVDYWNTVWKQLFENNSLILWLFLFLLFFINILINLTDVICY